MCGRAAARACNGVIPGAVTRCWATSLLMLIPELYSPLVGCESLPLTLPNVIFKPGALPSLRSCCPSSSPLAAPGVCRGGAAGCSALRFGVLRPPSPVAVWHHVPVPRSSKLWLVRNTFLQSPADGNELPSAGSWFLEEVHVLPAAPAALSDATGSYSRRLFHISQPGKSSRFPRGSCCI